MTTPIMPKGFSVPPITQQRAQELAETASTALKKMGTVAQDLVMAEVKGTLPGITKGIHSRLQRRTAKDLEKLIGEQPTILANAGARIASLKEALQDEKPKKVEAALVRMVTKHGVTEEQFDRLVEKLERLAELVDKGALQQIPKPIKEKLGRLEAMADGSARSIAQMAGQDLFTMAYKQLHQKVDVDSD